mmetsp:Transcript_27621/g.60947  ORF Transcript_27621/g.60947 Transcript_27621/m.60947 type:complete len:120 (-) Transcript_27621:367-726(-)
MTMAIQSSCDSVPPRPLRPQMPMPMMIRKTGFGNNTSSSHKGNGFWIGTEYLVSREVDGAWNEDFRVVLPQTIGGNKNYVPSRGAAAENFTENVRKTGSSGSPTRKRLFCSFSSSVPTR